MVRKPANRNRRRRHKYSQDFRQEAVQMVLDGHSVASVASRLGLSSANLLYRWKKDVIGRAGPAARTLGDRVCQLEEERRRVERERDISKTSVEHFKPERVADLYALIEHHSLKGIFSVSSECDTLDVSRADYYAWRSSVETDRQRRDRELTPLIADIFWKHQRRYGARRIAVELIALGQPCGVDRVANLMKNQRLRAIQPKSFVPKTTDSRHTLGYHPNLLLNAPPPQRMNQVWVADMPRVCVFGCCAFRPKSGTSNREPRRHSGSDFTPRPSH